MKKIVKYIFVVVSLFLFLACEREEPKYTIPARPAYFTINTAFLDNNLANIGSINIYIKSSDKNAYDVLLNGVKGVQTFEAPRLENEYIGYSGLLIINTGSTLSPTPFAAFDLCCPHEGMEKVRVIPTNNGNAKCPKCGSVYDIILGTGQVLEGISTKNLQSYYVAPVGNSAYRVYYY